ncbi:MAG: 5-methyltetrahydropteroyltriglutamate--homocysteine S-methyltransferase [Paludibacteraceae bacterium]|nr:5-methyltetrahydropteroyltriglutamate--homocysteine S-methyltransferase [Paludibacteraceae bacterium]
MTKSIRTKVLGFPRIGAQRELKKAEEAFWAGKATREELETTARQLRLQNWRYQQETGIDLIPSNDFSFYDQVLDLSLTLGVIPERYKGLEGDPLTLYFAMARGYQSNGKDIIASEMTKWFDTNYHYIVPEFVKGQTFRLFDRKPVEEYLEAKSAGIETQPVLVGPVSFLLLGKARSGDFRPIELIDSLLPVYVELLNELSKAGVKAVQIDEPYLALDLDEESRAAYKKAYDVLSREAKVEILLATYFAPLEDNASLALSLPVKGLHIDLVRGEGQLDEILDGLKDGQELSLGIVDGRNVWKNDFDKSVGLVKRAIEKIGADRVIVSGSSSFLHVPYDLQLETNERTLPKEVKRWLSYAKEKVQELSIIADLASGAPSDASLRALEANRADIADKASSSLIHDAAVKARAAAVTEKDVRRPSGYAVRAALQRKELGLPHFPTTTIGSFPQTKEVRQWRSKFKKGEITSEEYDRLLKEETERTIRLQEEWGLDVLVHGEFERNDMVEYFGEQLSGFAFTKNGWVQSYGSRCVKPPIIYGDVSRPKPMTVDWAVYAQSRTQRYVKGMLTGPVTILEWSFVRNDQPRSETTRQIALAIRDEVNDLEKAGIRIIQIDEPAIREGLPLRHSGWSSYLKWAVESFRLSTSGVKDSTQIHTHMCYSEFNDIIDSIADMDADVITIECSRSQMELLDIFRTFHYPNEIGPGVYDIHSPRVPDVQEMVDLLDKAAALIDKDRLWVNPDCGLKTRGWAETEASLKNMIEATKIVRKKYYGE